MERIAVEEDRVARVHLAMDKRQLVQYFANARQVSARLLPGRRMIDPA